MTTPINPGDVYKYITVAYKDKEFARNIIPDALAFDGHVKKWFIKPQFKEHEALFKAYNPQYPSAIRVPESHKPLSVSRQEVTPLKVKVGSLSTSVLNNPHVKNLVLNIKETYSTEEKLFLSLDQIRDDLQYEMESVFHQLKETIVENAMSQHFNAFIDHSCVKNLLDYFVGVASSTQTEALALMGNDDDDDEEVQELKKQLLRRKMAKRIRADVTENSGRAKRRREDVDEKTVDENTRLALQIENDNLLATLAQMREEMRSLIKVGGNEVQATPLSSLVDLASSPQAFSSSSSSGSSLTTTTPLVTAQQTSGVTAQEIVVQPTLVKTINVKVEKKSGNNNLFVILT